VGSTAAAPARVGECEKAVVALSVTGEVGDGWWDREGALRDSSVREKSGVATVAGGVRLNRQWQVGLAAPLLVNHRASESLSGWGGGVGDVRLSALWDPFEERAVADRLPAPVPLFILGTRLPTGRDWTHSSSVLHEDVTGLEQSAVVVGGQLERTLDKWPWSVGATTELGLGSLGLQPLVRTNGSLGRYLGHRWTVIGTLGHQIGWATLEAGGHASAQTWSGVQVVHGSPGRWRAWVGGKAGLPIRGAGVSATRTASVSTGLAVIL